MSNDFLTREEILSLNDIETKVVTIPEHIPGWGGKSLHIRQLSRGQQDAYMRRRFGGTTMQQDRKGGNQEIKVANLFGHDAWLFVRGVCDENMKPIFTDADLAKLEARNGEAIGWVALEIVKFSGMAEDVRAGDEAKSEEEAAAEEIKN